MKTLSLPVPVGPRIMLCIAALFIPVAPAIAQVVFGSLVGPADNPVSALFEVNNGNVTAINTGLPNNQYAALSPDGAQLTISSPDPQQPFEASWDLFAFDRNTGQTRRLVNNQTQELPGGGHVFSLPQFSHTSSNGQLVAFVNLVSNTGPDGGGSVRLLEVIRSSDGMPVSLAEISSPNGQTDFYQSEFFGVSWLPGTVAFASPAYVPANELDMVAAGIMLYAPDGTGQYGRAALLTQPTVLYLPHIPAIIAETHALPAFSPNGQSLAFFSITYTDPLMSQPAQARLMLLVAGQSPVELVTFEPGVFPAGLSWSRDGTGLVFAVAAQSQTGPVGQGGSFQPLFVPETAILRTLDLGSGTIAAIPGAPAGYFPNGVPLSNVIFQSGFAQ